MYSHRSCATCLDFAYHLSTSAFCFLVLQSKTKSRRTKLHILASTSRVPWANKNMNIHEPFQRITKKIRKSTGFLCPMSVTHLQDSYLHLCYLWSVLPKLQPQWRSQSNVAFPNMPTSSLPSQVHGMLQSSGNAENAWNFNGSVV